MRVFGESHPLSLLVASRLPIQVEDLGDRPVHGDRRMHGELVGAEATPGGPAGGGDVGGGDPEHR